MLDVLISGQYYSRLDSGKKIRKSFDELEVQLKDIDDKREVQEKANLAIKIKYKDALSIRIAKIDKVITK